MLKNVASKCYSMQSVWGDVSVNTNDIINEKNSHFNPNSSLTSCNFQHLLERLYRLYTLDNSSDKSNKSVQL